MKKATLPLRAHNNAAFCELRAQTATQLAYAYALYLAYIRQQTVRDMFSNEQAPVQLQIVDPAERGILLRGPPEAAKQLVRQTMVKIKTQHESWIRAAAQEQETLLKDPVLKTGAISRSKSFSPEFFRRTAFLYLGLRRF